MRRGKPDEGLVGKHGLHPAQHKYPPRHPNPPEPNPRPQHFTLAHLPANAYICRLKTQSERKPMLIIDVKEGESIDRALKKYKRKFERAGLMRSVRDRKYFTKPSVKRREEVLNAVYKKQTYGS